MISFDPGTKFLTLSEKRLDQPATEYVESDQYKSYKKYLNEGVEKDIRNILIPALNSISDNTMFVISQDKFNVSTVKSNILADMPVNNIIVSLCKEFNSNTVVNPDGSVSFSVGDKMSPNFTLLEMPFMEKSGILKYRGKNYVILNALYLDDAITFNGKELKFVDNDHSLVFEGTSNPKIKMFNTSISLIDFASMTYTHFYGKDDGREYSKNFIRSLRNPNLLSTIVGTEDDFKEYGEDTFEKSLDQITGLINEQRAEDFDIKGKYDKGLFDTGVTRRALNEMLSFKAAVGKTLSRDIVNSDGKTIAHRGEQVTKGLVHTLNYNMIDTIHVVKKSSVIGQYLADPIILGNQIIRGTPIIPEMVEIIPELVNYQVVSKNYDLGDRLLIVDKNRIVTDELCEYLNYVGIKYFYYKETQNSKKKIPAYFEEEYINNRHFLVDDLPHELIDGLDVNSRYVYVDLNGNITEESGVLTCHDVSALISLYMKLIAGEHFDIVSDPDAGLRKKVNQCYDHFHKAFEYATNTLIKTNSRYIRENLESCIVSGKIDELNRMFSRFTDYFVKYLRNQARVMDTLDMMNPVSVMSFLTRVNTIVKNPDSIADSMRRLTMGHYGRICPYETPQSKKLGVVNNMATQCSIVDGVMRTNYYKLKRVGDDMYVILEKIPMSVVEEENYRIADICDIDFDWDTGKISTTGKVLARVPSNDSLEKMTVAWIDIKYVEYISVSVNQHCSIATTTVPYPGSDDAARVSFGMSMVKQAKGLIKGEIPIVCTTGFQTIPNMNTFFKIFAEEDGRVLTIRSGSIVVRYAGSAKETEYNFQPMTITTNTVIVRVTEVVEGDRIKKGQTLVSSNFVQDGVMTLGVNALVAYTTDGYNYEDGVPASERVANKLTSYGVHSDSFSISRSTRRVAVQDANFSSYMDPGDYLFNKLESKGSDVTDLSRTRMYSKHCRGFMAKYELIRDEDVTKHVKEIKVKSVSFDRLGPSDKICNRHGNKGVTCHVHKNSDMLYLENGEFIDIKYNPNGIVSRMNIGQEHEAFIGLACYVLGIRVLCDSFDSPNQQQIKDLLSYAVDLANSTDVESVIAKYPQYPESLHDHCRDNIEDIRHWKGTFNKEGKAFLIDPVSGKRSLKRVNIGVNYIYKLVQEGEGKLHHRGGQLSSSYVHKTESPTSGASKGGGQRQGYMELDALSAYGATAILNEIMNERSDNYIERNNMTVDVLHSGDGRYKINPKYGIRRSTEQLVEAFRALGLEVEFTNDEIDLKHPEERKYYKRRVLVEAKFDGDVEEKSAEDVCMDVFKQFGQSKLNELNGDK